MQYKYKLPIFSIEHVLGRYCVTCYNWKPIAQYRTYQKIEKKVITDRHTPSCIQCMNKKKSIKYH